MLKTEDLNFEYPNELVAQSAKPRGESRILSLSRDKNFFEEIHWQKFFGLFQKGDTLVLNDSRVIWARLKIQKLSGARGEIFFLRAEGLKWQVLTKGLKLKVGKVIDLPGNIKATTLKYDRISEIEISENVDIPKYFEKYGSVPLPPYITSLRDDNSDFELEDRKRYQTVWAKSFGSVAAPTAGLHFTEEHLKILRDKGVSVQYVTLHVGAGTFLPIETENLDDFQIHSEFIEVGSATCFSILKTQAAGKKIWACGTTALRALETAVQASSSGSSRLPLIAPFIGETSLFIRPGYTFLVVDGLLTNFHQPKSSLLSLVAAFATRNQTGSRSDAVKAVEKVKDVYKWAMEKKFRLFSYGDLTVIS
jgi:S-adenosylmethionine:tRNA ribosyltransferase-isomerase